MKPIDVTAILPVYNGAGHVENILGDLLRQRGLHLEILVIDDGSTDATGSVLARFKSAPNVNVIRFEENAGVSSARNSGISRARGEFIFFVDADDRLSGDDGLCRLVEEARSDGCDMVWLPLRQPRWGQVLEPGTTLRRCDGSWSTLIAQSILDEVINSPIKLYRSDIVRRSRAQFIEDLAMAEDLVFNLEVLAHVKVIKYSRNEVYRIVGSENSATRAPAPGLLGHLQRALSQAERAAPDVDPAVWCIINYKNQVSVRRRQLQGAWLGTALGNPPSSVVPVRRKSVVRPTTRFGARWTVLTTIFALLTPNQVASVMHVVARPRKARHSRRKAAVGMSAPGATVGDCEVPPE